jgi:hypothetical protein
MKLGKERSEAQAQRVVIRWQHAEKRRSSRGVSDEGMPGLESGEGCELDLRSNEKHIALHFPIDDLLVFMHKHLSSELGGAVTPTESLTCTPLNPRHKL